MRWRTSPDLPKRPVPLRTISLAAHLAALLALLAGVTAACTDERTATVGDTSSPSIPPQDATAWPDLGAWQPPPGARDAGDASAPSDAAPRPDVPPDAGRDGGGPGPDVVSPAWPATFGPAAPPAGATPEPLRGETWLAHLEADLLPFWRMPEALGDPVGNFPTYRTMEGQVASPGERRPRMISRQIYAYSMAFLLTGDATLLAHAHAGTEWLLAHARDERGGCHARLDASGDPIGDEPKTAQDTAYCALGPAAYFFVTRDPAAEAFVLELRDLLFDPAVFWDAEAGRVRDAVSADLAQEVDVEGDDAWELVAQLDPINAFLLLVQPVLSEESRRTQVAGDLRTLGDAIVTHFLDDERGVFWGVHTAVGQWRSKHADFGHTLKAWWMLLQLQKRLPDAPYGDLLAAHVRPLLDLAFDDANGRWGKRITAWPEGGAPTIEWGSDWWSYAEADQLALTVDLLGGAHSLEPWLVLTQANWVSDYVDRTRDAREVVPSVDRTGEWVFPWPDSDTAKANLWKNGYHSVEHALVSYLHGQWRGGEPAVLHFAVPPAAVDDFAATPYLFQGSETRRTVEGEITIDGAALQHVVVQFEELY